MCLYPKLILNKKYLPTKKNNFCPPPLKDIRLKYVAVGCGYCYECRKQKSRAWQVRLSEEIKYNKYNYFVTLTFSEEELTKLEKELKTTNTDIITIKAVRRFLERYRKKYKKSIKHWLINELGHKNTERLHLHGLLMRDTPMTNEELTEIWKYGRTDTGKYVNDKTINYITKYVTKVDQDHKYFMPKICCSRGIGAQYTKDKFYKKVHRYIQDNTIEYYTLDNGIKINLPIYYRNKLFTEIEREKLWIDRINKGILFVNKIPIDISTNEGMRTYERILATQQKWNEQVGYGNSEWHRTTYQTRLLEQRK